MVVFFSFPEKTAKNGVPSNQDRPQSTHSSTQVLPARRPAAARQAAARRSLGPDFPECRGSKPMVPFRGRCTTHFRTYFSGEWDVHWGYGILTHGRLYTWHFSCSGSDLGFSQFLWFSCHFGGHQQVWIFGWVNPVRK